MKVQMVVYCNVLKTFYSWLVQKKKNTFKSIFQKLSGYTEVKVTEEDLYLV